MICKNAAKQIKMVFPRFFNPDNDFSHLETSKHFDLMVIASTDSSHSCRLLVPFQVLNLLLLKTTSLEVVR